MVATQLANRGVPTTAEAEGLPGNDLIWDAITSATDVARLTIDRERRWTRPYLHLDPEGRSHFTRHPGRDAQDLLEHGDPTNHATATAFVVSTLLRPSSNPPVSARLTIPGLDSGEWQLLRDTMVADFVSLYTNPTAFGGKEARRAPNAYSTALHVAGICSVLWRHPQLEHDKEAVRQPLRDAIELILKAVEACPYQTSLSLEPEVKHGLHDLVVGTPNCYLTRLVADALAAALRVPRAIDTALADRSMAALASIHDAMLLVLARQVACHSAGLRSMFDASDLASAISAVGACEQAVGRRDELSDGVMRAALEILFSTFQLEDGSLAPKSAAFVDEKRRQMVTSSAELVVGVLARAGQHFTPALLSEAQGTVRNAARRSRGYRGWGDNTEQGDGKPDIFSAASSWALLTSYVELSEKSRSRDSLNDLGAVWPVPGRMAWYNYPANISRQIQNCVIVPLRNGQRDKAFMSLVLHGPPGTSKTTLARKIADDLGWPFLEISPAMVLRSGADHIEMETQKLFETLPHIRDSVVLFDEFENLIARRGGVTERSASLLTTAMLPRLHGLRDDGRILFVIATNHLSEIDSAAVRPGRIDGILELLPPSDEERKEMLAGLSRRFFSLDDDSAAHKFLTGGEVLDGTKGFTYGYLENLARQIALVPQEEYTDGNARSLLNAVRTRYDDEVAKNSGDLRAGGKR